MATKIDYYEILEVTRTVSSDELKKAYRKLAMKYHPDRNPGDEAAEAKFKEINQAYDVLKDEQKRAAYDRFGHAAFENGGGGGPGGFDFNGFGGGGGLGDIFEQMFGDMMGGRRGGGRARTGNDIQTHVEITLEEAFTGVKRRKIITRVACDSCHGTGSNAGESGVETCPSCHGAGKVRAQQGFFVVERPCPTCHGAGRVVKDPCKACHGEGTVEKERTLAVQIPAGVEDGTRIRITGEGESGGQGVPAGDLYVHVSVSEHGLFQRDGANIYCRVPLRMGQAALGTEIEVPVIDGNRAKVKIPAGTQTGAHFRLRGKGFSVLRSSARGDMFIQVTVETPQHLNKRQKELLEEFEKEAGENVKGSPEHTGFFARVRDFFENKG